MTSGAIEQAKQTLAMVPESKRNDAAVKAVQAAIDLAEQAQAVGPVTELEQKVAANPLDHQARFDLATALNAKGKRAEAAEQLLEIVRRDRKWNDDGARKQLVQFFEAWGGADEATVEGRKRLSTILFRSAFQKWTGFDRIRESNGNEPGPPCRSMPNIADPASFPKSFRCFRCPARCCCRAARCRSIFSSRAISPWSTMRFATATG